MDHRDALATAQGHLADLVGALTPDDMTRTSPCEGWTVADVLTHVCEVAEGGAAAFGAATDEPSGDLARRYDAAAALLRKTIEDDAVLTTSVPFAGRELPGGVRLSFAFADTLIHIWDVSRATGRDAVLDPALVAQALAVVALVPEESRGEGRPFGAIVPVADDADDLTRLLSLSGRSADWAPTS